MRDLRRGDPVIFRGWNHGEEGLHGVIAEIVGNKATVAYLSRSGSWLSGHMTPRDESGVTPGSWRARE